ncbi:MAG: hypothetical protein JG765_1526 [Cereibacter sp.]|jgi:hypothetical protein|nr:hypothetical protein [Cereibacter sp.]
MSTFLEVLQARSKSPLAVYQKFRVLVRSGGVLYLFVEGYDDKLFYSAICGWRGVEVQIFVTYGKKNLDKIYEIHEKAGEVPSSGPRFIRDRDFDEFLGLASSKDNLFLTCGYSVENYVCSEASFRKALEYRFGLDPYEVDLASDVALYSHAVEAINRWLLPVYAHALDCALAGLPVDLNKLNIEEYVKIVLAGKPLPPVLQLDELVKAGLPSATPSQESIGRAEAYLVGDHRLTIRGKYLLIVASEVMKAITSKYMLLHKGGKIQSFNRTACGPINPSSLFSALVVHADAPGRLLDALTPPTSVAA